MTGDKDKTINILRNAVNAIAYLIDESCGVAGLHRNGDLATWAELRRGGRFEDWLLDVDKAFDELERLDNESAPMSGETKRDDGGPAFPVPGAASARGLSIRDWFAGMAMQGLLANPNVVGFNPNNGWGLVNCTTAQIADYAKHIGDQMVLADGKGSQ